jgi:hypothetical protein
VVPPKLEERIREIMMEVPKIFDARSLGLFRVCLGILALWSLAERALLFGDFYSPTGAWPSTSNFLFCPEGAIPLWNDSLPWALMLFLGMVLACALTLGCYTRVVCIGLLVVFCLLHLRSPVIEYGADRVLRLMLLWGSFLPLGEKFGIRSSERAVHACGVAFLVLCSQLSLIYMGTLTSRMHESWWGEFTAVEMAFKFDVFSSHFARALLEFPNALKVATLLTLLIEAGAVIGIWLTFRSEKARLLLISLMVLFHCTIGILFHYWFFAAVMITFWFALLPTSFWEAFTRYAGIYAKEKRRAESSEPASIQIRRVIWASWICLLIFCVSLFSRQSDTCTLKDSRFSFVSILGLSQGWKFYGAYSTLDDGWYVVEGKSKTQGTLDLLTLHQPSPRTREKQRQANELPLRWRLLLVALRSRNSVAAFSPIVQSLCRQVPDLEGPVTVSYMAEPTSFDAVEGPISEAFVGNFYCE